MTLYLRGKAVKLDPAQAIGKGGEAEVFDLGDGRALKVFKAPEHVDFQGLPEQQQAARARLAEHQTKLAAFPNGLPARVVAPLELATDRKGKMVLGYTMPLVAGAEPLLRYGEAGFRRAGADAARVVELFRDLHRTLAGVHAGSVVVGDFNDLNVLVRGPEALLIDADSFQFGAWQCRVFTERFVDPLLCDPGASAPLLARPFTALSDWYAFNALLFQCLLCVGPFGGIHRPKDPARRVASGARALKRLTVLHPEVQYPKPAFPRARSRTTCCTTSTASSPATSAASSPGGCWTGWTSAAVANAEPSTPALPARRAARAPPPRPASASRCAGR